MPQRLYSGGTNEQQLPCSVLTCSLFGHLQHERLQLCHITPALGVGSVGHHEEGQAGPQRSHLECRLRGGNVAVQRPGGGVVHLVEGSTATNNFITACCDSGRGPLRAD